MGDDLERLSSVLDDLAAERDRAPRPNLTAEEVQVARTAAFLKAAEPRNLAPRDAFVDGLAARIRDQQRESKAGAPAAKDGPPVSRRGMLGKAVAAVASIAVAGAGGVAVYEQGKRNGYQEEAVDPLEAPMVADDWGEWMDTGHTVQAIGPGQAARFRAGAVEGFLVNPGAGKGVYALSAACTHMGCMISWLEGAGTFLCPCHGAQYNANGSVLSGIARHPLPQLQVRAQPDGRYYVWSVTEHPKVTTVAPYSNA